MSRKGHPIMHNVSDLAREWEAKVGRLEARIAQLEAQIKRLTSFDCCQQAAADKGRIEELEEVINDAGHIILMMDYQAQKKAWSKLIKKLGG